MTPVELVIDGRPLLAEAGRPILWVALEAGLYIPHLCAWEGLEASGGRCRLCWVEVEGEGRPQPSCLLPARDGLRVHTRSPAVDRLVVRAFQLLLSRHHLDCVRCPANRRCRLQEIARRRRLPLRPKDLVRLPVPARPDESRTELVLDPRRCVLCARCVHLCQQVVRKGVLDLVGRGLATRVGTFNGRPLAESGCGDCTACADVCPTGALWRRQPVS